MTNFYMGGFWGVTPGKTAVVYNIIRLRAGSVTCKFLKGYQECIQTDVYRGYDALKKLPGIYLVD